MTETFTTKSSIHYLPGRLIESLLESWFTLPFPVCAGMHFSIATCKGVTIDMNNCCRQNSWTIWYSVIEISSILYVVNCLHAADVYVSCHHGNAIYNRRRVIGLKLTYHYVLFSSSVTKFVFFFEAAEAFFISISVKFGIIIMPIECLLMLLAVQRFHWTPSGVCCVDQRFRPKRSIAPSRRVCNKDLYTAFIVRYVKFTCMCLPLSWSRYFETELQSTAQSLQSPSQSRFRRNAGLGIKKHEHLLWSRTLVSHGGMATYFALTPARPLALLGTASPTAVPLPKADAPFFFKAGLRLRSTATARPCQSSYFSVGR